MIVSFGLAPSFQGSATVLLAKGNPSQFDPPEK
jgi:hypothetical protein